MGSADPRSFSRGKRGVAGSLIFLVFDRSALLDTLGRRSRYLANSYEVNTYQSKKGILDDINSSSLGPKTFSVGAGGVISTTDVNAVGNNSTFSTVKVLAAPQYHDQLPPFEVVVTAAKKMVA
jgi:hypothetical protein